MPEPTLHARREDPTFSERLWPGMWVWLGAVASVGALAIAYAGALGSRVGWLVALVGGALALLLIVRAAARITVGPDALRAGRARLPLALTGRVIPLDADRARTARGPGGDPTAYLLLRPGVGPGAVVVEVTDPTDPHRTWLLASRHPQRLASAILDARGRLSP